jgi:hypothetical protein
MINIMSKKVWVFIKKISALAIFAWCISFLAPGPISAQNFSLNISNAVTIEGNAPDGSIVSYEDGKYVLSHVTYDKNVVGVVTLNPDIEYENNATLQGTFPLVSSGTTHVRVSAQNGPINQGDFISTSDKPGVGTKATKTGFIIGRAEGDFNPSNSSDEGIIVITLDIKFAFSSESPLSEQIGDRLQSLVNINLEAALDNPVLTLRFVLATVEVIIVCGFAFLTFGRVALEGVSAVGRNPMARKEIAIGMVFNVLVAITISIIGCGVAYFIVTYK